MSSDLKLEPATARRQPGLRAVIANCLASSAALAACRHMDIYVFGVFQGLSVAGAFVLGLPISGLLSATCVAHVHGMRIACVWDAYGTCMACP